LPELAKENSSLTSFPFQTSFLFKFLSRPGAYSWGASSICVIKSLRKTI